MSTTIHCPHCRKSVGGSATEGGLRVRLGITLVDPASGAIHGPCPFCKADIVVCDESKLSKSLESNLLIPALRIRTT